MPAMRPRSLSVFFFKQKTAYEMRISDWSSDVCSSDLPPPGRNQPPHQDGRAVGAAGNHGSQHRPGRRRLRSRAEAGGVECPGGEAAEPALCRHACRHAPEGCRQAGLALWRSEEHTSELPSLMRISYAVL